MVSAALIAEVFAHAGFAEKIEVRTRTHKKTSIAYVLLVTVSLTGLHSIQLVEYQFWKWTIFELFLTVLPLLPYFLYKETNTQCRRDILPFKVVVLTIAACLALMIFNVLSMTFILENFPFRDISLRKISKSNQPTEKFIDLALSVIPRIGALFPLLAVAKELTVGCFIRPERVAQPTYQSSSDVVSDRYLVTSHTKQLNFVHSDKQDVITKGTDTNSASQAERSPEVACKVAPNHGRPRDDFEHVLQEIQQLVLKQNSVPETRQGKDHTASKLSKLRRQKSPETETRCEKDSGFESGED